MENPKCSSSEDSGSGHKGYGHTETIKTIEEMHGIQNKLSNDLLTYTSWLVILLKLRHSYAGVKVQQRGLGICITNIKWFIQLSGKIKQLLFQVGKCFENWTPNLIHLISKNIKPPKLLFICTAGFYLLSQLSFHPETALKHMVMFSVTSR